MRLARLVAIVLMASLLVATAPVSIWAADGATALPGVRASIAGAVAKTAASHQRDIASRALPRRANAAAGQTGGGGGSKAMAIVAILSTVGGLAATYFVVKQMRKQSNTGQ
jgi:hypothetical protein